MFPFEVNWKENNSVNWQENYDVHGIKLRSVHWIPVKFYKYDYLSEKTLQKIVEENSD